MTSIKKINQVGSIRGIANNKKTAEEKAALIAASQARIARQQERQKAK